MAALIAAQGRGTGLVGIAPGGKILPVAAQSTPVYVKGVRFAVDHGAQVINLSQGFPVTVQAVLNEGTGCSRCSGGGWLMERVEGRGALLMGIHRDGAADRVLRGAGPAPDRLPCRDALCVGVVQPSTPETRGLRTGGPGREAANEAGGLGVGLGRP